MSSLVLILPDDKQVSEEENEIDDEMCDNCWLLSRLASESESEAEPL